MGANDIRWEPRVPEHKIRRLDENDATGIIDKELVDDVAYRLYTLVKVPHCVRDDGGLAHRRSEHREEP